MTLPVMHLAGVATHSQKSAHHRKWQAATLSGRQSLSGAAACLLRALILIGSPSAAQERDQLELERQQANMEKLQLDTEVTEKGS